MLASIRADTGAAVTNGCAECHSGVAPSVRGGVAQVAACHVVHASLQRCNSAPRRRCPTGRGQTARGVTSARRCSPTGASTPTTPIARSARAPRPAGVTCVVCHDPHGSGNPKQLRYPVDSRDPDNNLCVKCHNRRGQPDFSGGQNARTRRRDRCFSDPPAGGPRASRSRSNRARTVRSGIPKLCAGLPPREVRRPRQGDGEVPVDRHRAPLPCHPVRRRQRRADAMRRPAPQRSASFKSCAGVRMPLRGDGAHRHHHGDARHQGALHGARPADRRRACERCHCRRAKLRRAR